VPHLLRRRALGVVLLALLGNQPSAVEWRNVTVPLPDDWYVFEEADTRLSISNQDIGPEALRTDGAPAVDEPVVAMFFTYEPMTRLPDDWRRYVEEQDATLEVDDRSCSTARSRDPPRVQLRHRRCPPAGDGRRDPVALDRRAVPAGACGRGHLRADVFLAYVETFIRSSRRRASGPVLD
jgi:hypothetical protein